MTCTVLWIGTADLPGLNIDHDEKCENGDKDSQEHDSKTTPKNCSLSLVLVVTGRLPEIEAWDYQRYIAKIFMTRVCMIIPIKSDNPAIVRYRIPRMYS